MRWCADLGAEGGGGQLSRKHWKRGVGGRGSGGQWSSCFQERLGPRPFGRGHANGRVVEVDVRTPCAPAHRVWPRALIERHIRHRGEVCRCAPPWQGFAQRSSTQTPEVSNKHLSAAQTPELYMCWNSVSLLPAVSSLVRERRGAVSIFSSKRCMSFSRPAQN